MDIAPTAAPSDEVAPWICEPTHNQTECGTCGIHGHAGQAPLLVEGISR